MKAGHSGEINSRAYVSNFQLSGSDQKKRQSECFSGGERNRVHLAMYAEKKCRQLLLPMSPYSKRLLDRNTPTSFRRKPLRTFGAVR